MLAATKPTQPVQSRAASARGMIEHSTSLREAFQLLLAIDSQASPTEIQAKGVAFMERFLELVKTPGNRFIPGFFSFCISARSRELGRNVPAKDFDLVPPTGFPDSIWYGITTLGNIARYTSCHGPEANDGWGTLAFQRDVCNYIESLAKEARNQSPLANETLIKLNEFAANVIVCFRKNLNERSAIAATAADEVTRTLKACEEVTEPMAKLLTSQLSLSENLALPKALAAILRRIPDPIPGCDRGTISRLTEWAKQERLTTVEELDAETRKRTLRTLEKATHAVMDDELAASLELKWMNAVEAPLRSFKFSINVAAPSPLPRLMGATRLQREALPHLERAAAEIAREGLTGLSLEIDRSPFVWPKLAEIIAISKPSAVTLHTGSETSAPPLASASTINPLFLSNFGKVHLPLALAVNPVETLRHELALLTQQELSWISPTEGRCDCLGRTISLRLSEDLTTSGEVRKLTGYPKPVPLAFTMRDPNCEPLPDNMPRAFGVLFSDMKREVAGYKRLEFGGMLTLFVSLNKPERKRASSQSPAPAAPASTKRSSSGSAPKRVEATPPPREQRPSIPSDLATVAKIALLEIPSTQQAARQSTALHPRIPFSEQELIVTLNILKNGERPGTKSLKALRAYISEDGNFKDCGLSATPVRTSLASLVDQLLSK